MFADAIDLQGDTLAVNGDPVRVFTRGTDGSWTNVPLAVESLGPVDLDENVLVIGARQDSSNVVIGNDVHVFQRAGGAWSPVPASPLVAGSNVDAGFGFSVASAGRVVFVGAPFEAPSGAVYIYE